jgi:hypothetical protein
VNSTGENPERSPASEHQHKRLAEALRTLERRQSLFVPPTLDENILAKARPNFAGTTAHPQIRWPAWKGWFLAITGSAAVLLLAFFSSRTSMQRFSNVRASQDINGDGRVDILDAMALARLLERKPPALSPALDQNGDHRVDQADVAALANAAVRLEGRRL